MNRESTLDRLFHRVPPEWYAIEAFFLDHCRRYPDCGVGDKPCRFYHRELTDFCDKFRMKDVLK